MRPHHPYIAEIHLDTSIIIQITSARCMQIPSKETSSRNNVVLLMPQTLEVDRLGHMQGRSLGLATLDRPRIASILDFEETQMDFEII